MATLALALVNVGFALAPLGIDGIVNRRSVEAGPGLLGRTLLAAGITAAAFALIGALAYETSATAVGARRGYLRGDSRMDASVRSTFYFAARHLRLPVAAEPAQAAAAR